MSTILDLIQDRIGDFAGDVQTPPAGSNQATLTAVLGPGQAADATNSLRLVLLADWGNGPRRVACSPLWKGGLGQTAPSLVWAWSPDDPPLYVWGWLENVTQVVDGLALSFATVANPPLPQRWWKARTPQMAFSSWLQQQDRSGTENGPRFAVPPGCT